jgi:hypothetical protein
MKLIKKASRFRFSRVALAWHVLCGQPLMYRMHFRDDAIVVDKPNRIWIIENHIESTSSMLTTNGMGGKEWKLSE